MNNIGLFPAKCVQSSNSVAVTS